MGKKDEYQFDYLDDNHRFADQVNGALFQGRQVVKPEELEPADAQFVYLGKEAGARKNFRAIVDRACMWKAVSYPGCGKPDLCRLPYGSSKYADGEPELSETMETKKAGTRKGT